MGTDIHVQVEVRKKGKWTHSPDRLTECWVCTGSGKGKDGKNCWLCNGTGQRVQEVYEGRNYRLFAILAGVRNGVGFAGIRMGEPVTPIAEPRGAPEDMSPEVEEYMSHADHSETWVTLAELLAYRDAERDRIAQYGVITWAEYLEWRSKPARRPDSYCGDTFGPGVRTYSQEEVEALLRAGKEPREKSPHVRVTWYEDVADPLREGEMARAIEYLETLGAPEDVRLVMYFDS